MAIYNLETTGDHKGFIMSKIEEIMEAAKGRFKQEDYVIDKDKDISITVVEISRKDGRELDKKVFEQDDKGEFVTVDKDGNLDPDGKSWKVKKDITIIDEWISACTEPKLKVEDIVDWPESMKNEIYEVVNRVNNVETTQEAAKN